MKLSGDQYDDNGEIKSLTNPQMDSNSETESTLKSKVTRMLRQNALIISTMVAIGMGFCLGLGLRHANMSENGLMWLGLPGELFLRCLKSTIVPLVVCMVITCTATLDPKSNGKIALVAILGFFFTQVFATIVAIIMFYVFKADSGTQDVEVEEFSTNLQTQDVFADLLRNIFPSNVVGAAISQTMTVYSREEEEQTNSSSATNATEKVVRLVRSSEDTRGINILGLITICTALGVAANKNLSPDSEFLRFFRQAQDIIFTVMGWLFWTTPVGVASLIAKSIASVDDIGEVFVHLGMLVAAVTVGLTIHLLGVLPAVLFVFTRRNPFRVISRSIRPFFIAFASTATSVAMPEMLTSCDSLGIDPNLSAFVIPMSVTLHADGSALYMASAALFIAQTSGQGIGVGEFFVIGTLSSVLALAIPPVPSSSIVTLVIILTSINVPLHDVALLFAVEWLLDRYRSGVNAVSHVMVAAYTDAVCSKKDVANVGRDHVVRAEYVIESDHDDTDADDIEDKAYSYKDVDTPVTVVEFVEDSHTQNISNESISISDTCV